MNPCDCISSLNRERYESTRSMRMRRLSSVGTCTPIFRTATLVLTTFPIVKDICMEEHTCDMKSPHNNRKLKGWIAGQKGAVPRWAGLGCYWRRRRWFGLAQDTAHALLRSCFPCSAWPSHTPHANGHTHKSLDKEYCLRRDKMCLRDEMYVWSKRCIQHSHTATACSHTSSAS